MREESTARNLQDYQVAPQPEKVVQAAPKVHSVKLSKFETFFYCRSLSFNVGTNGSFS